MNKVLNRPLFRQVALKKGKLKTIKANTGIMVGQPYTPPGVPAVVKGQGTFSPVNTQRFGPPKPTMFQKFNARPSVRFGKELLSIPVQLGFQAGGKLADAFGMPKGFNVGRLGLEALGSYGAARALPGLAVSSIGLLPSAVGLATIAGVQNRVKAGIEERKRINAMTPKERAEFSRQNRLKATDYMSEGVTSEDLFGKFIPKPPKPVKVKVSAKPGEPNPGSGRPSFRVTPDKTAELKAEGDQLLDEKYAGADGDANLDTIQADSISSLPTPPGAGDDQREKIAAGADKDTPATESKELVLSQKEKKIQMEQDAKATNNAINGGSGKKGDDFDQTIALAKRYYEAMDDGRGSNAQLIFLTNLASGLLTGTTKKQGVGGALEVLGQALGPAVNNYVTVKMKEGEIRGNRREASLNAALDHMKFLNDAAKTERPDLTPGVVQFRGADGVLRNYNGYIGKGGTTYLPGGLGDDGQERLIPISQSGPIQDSEGNVIGTFEDFKAKKDIGKRLFEIQDILGNRYNALSVARDVLQTLNQEDQSGDKVKAGAALSVDTFTRRLSGVAKELVGLDILDNDITNLTLGQLEEKALQLQEDEYRRIDESDLSEKAKKEAKELLSKENLIADARKRLKRTGFFSELDREEQEKLAVQETTLVYALANTFKDQDRLTQRDIDAARNIVNIFSLTRSSADVRASINAIASQLESDIRRQEELYRQAGGLETTITNLRNLAEFETFKKGTVAEQLAGDLSLEDIEQGLQDVNL
jgi:hypothetical protein|tara:strand:- start:2976 stop:5255 length:2280 start_codon:yes stop_codon:yes gene_type:complete